MKEFDFVSITPILKGWSEDKKYHCIDQLGNEVLLRISPSQRLENRKHLYQALQEVSALNIPMCKPLFLEVIEEGVATYHTWINGEDAEDILPFLSAELQYQYGVESGKILQKIHTLPAPKGQEEWESRFNRKVDIKIKQYLNCPDILDKGSLMIEYLKSHRFLLAHRPQSFQHGDYHIGNMMMEDGKLIIIDFDRLDYGDPWEEFNRIVFSAKLTPEFACGQLDGYFNGTPPLEFFELLMYYMVLNTISSVPWAMQFGQKEIDTMRENSKIVLEWYDDLHNPIPSWYKKR